MSQKEKMIFDELLDICQDADFKESEWKRGYAHGLMFALAVMNGQPFNPGKLEELCFDFADQFATYKNVES